MVRRAAIVLAGSNVSSGHDGLAVPCACAQRVQYAVLIPGLTGNAAGGPGPVTADRSLPAAAGVHRASCGASAVIPAQPPAGLVMAVSRRHHRERRCRLRNDNDCYRSVPVTGELEVISVGDNLGPLSPGPAATRSGAGRLDYQSTETRRNYALDMTTWLTLLSAAASTSPGPRRLVTGVDDGAASAWSPGPPRPRRSRPTGRVGAHGRTSPKLTVGGISPSAQRRATVRLGWVGGGQDRRYGRPRVGSCIQARMSRTRRTGR